MWWQFLTAGFTHAPAGVGPGVWHIAGNMLVLFFLGRSVEDRYGPREFLRIYLATLVFANVAWCLVTMLTYGLNGPGIYGASGAIAGIPVYSIKDPGQQMSPAALATGASPPYNIMKPYLVNKCCIALQGIFPSRP